jgi:hypothetical protein
MLLLRVLRALDAFSHVALGLGHVPLPLTMYRLCVAVERQHDRVYGPWACPCCERPPGSADEQQDF